MSVSHHCSMACHAQAPPHVLLISLWTDIACALRKTLTDLVCCHKTVSKHCCSNVRLVNRHRRFEDGRDKSSISCPGGYPLRERNGSCPVMKCFHQICCRLRFFRDCLVHCHSLIASENVLDTGNGRILACH